MFHEFRNEGERATTARPAQRFGGHDRTIRAAWHKSPALDGAACNTALAGVWWTLTLATMGWLGSAAGCGPPVIDLAVPDQALSPKPTTYDDRPWATVLRENVKDKRVDYKHLSSHRAPLDRYLAMLAAFGPTRTPDVFATRGDRVCYYVNAHNAVVLAAVLAAGMPDVVHGVRFGSIDRRYRLVVDGRPSTALALEDVAIETAGDPRVVFAMCDAALGSPPLHDQPLRPDGLDETLRKLSERAMDNPHIVTIDHERQTLLLSTALAARRDEFIQYYRNQTGAKSATMLNVVLHFAGPVRRQWLNTAVGYSERIIPFDRRLNRWRPSGEPAE